MLTNPPPASEHQTQNTRLLEGHYRVRLGQPKILERDKATAFSIEPVERPFAERPTRHRLEINTVRAEYWGERCQADLMHTVCE
jgi:hypothetical protein